MTSSSHLRPGDVELMLALLEESRRDDPGPQAPWALLEGLRSLAGADTIVSLQVIDVPGRRWLAAQEVVGDVRESSGSTDGTGPPFPVNEDDEAYFAATWVDPMCSYHLRTGDLTSVLLLSDFFPTARDVLDRPLCRDFHPDVRALVEVALPATPGLARRIVLGRTEGPPFDERDRQVLALLRPHLVEIVQDAHRRRVGAPRLTRREQEVLALTAAGLTHAEIAERLVVSVSTVRKHMENVRSRLGVHSAAAAAALALPSGSLAAR